mgnify:CR=1 FL=1
MTNKSFPQFVSPVPAEVSIARHSFPTALDYADTVRLPSLSLALARAHHAGVSCGCIARMHCADACVCIMRPRPRPQEKNFFPGKRRPHQKLLQGDSTLRGNPKKHHRQSMDFIYRLIAYRYKSHPAMKAS